MGKIKEELMQLESDIGNAIEQLEQILDISILDDKEVHDEILKNPEYVKFIQLHVNDKGLSKFKDVQEFLKIKGGN